MWPASLQALNREENITAFITMPLPFPSTLEEEIRAFGPEDDDDDDCDDSIDSRNWQQWENDIKETPDFGDY